MPRNIHRHFSNIATRYNELRTTDLEVAGFIADKLRPRTPIHVANVGCGSGRYAIELLRRLSGGIDLICVDCNFAMLRTLQEELRQRNLHVYGAVQAAAQDLPFPDQHLGAVVTFNAFHLFEIPSFLHECARTLQAGGLLLVYTRLRSQNKRNIWGRYFPSFVDKEYRLLEQQQLENLFEDTPRLQVEEAQYFKFDRQASLDWLLEQGRNHHYSTFTFYSALEFETAMKRFEKNIRDKFHDPAHVTWQDENILLVVRRGR
jgi:ubiquinone/menaquinone biosynthesis C-methylase UbiE